MTAAAFVLGAATPAAAAAPFTVADSSKLVALQEPALSPDGRSAAVVVRRANLAEDTYSTDLELVDIASGSSRGLTFARKDVASPAFSPRGDRIAFLAAASDEKDAPTQLFVLSLEGGDAQAITTTTEGVEQFAWRPGGESLAYVAQDDVKKKTGEARFHDAFEVTDDGYLRREAPKPEHVFLIAVGGGTARALTAGDDCAAAGEAQSTLSWSADGKSLAFTRVPSTILDVAANSHVEVLDVASDTHRTLSSNNAHERSALFSPVGTRIASTFARGDEQINLVDAFVTDGVGGLATKVAPELDRTVEDLAWNGDGSALYLAINDGTQHTLLEAPLVGKPRPLPLGGVSPASGLAGAVARDGSFVFVGSTPLGPSELYVLPHGAAAPRKLTNLNAAIAALALPTAEGFSFPGPDGFREDAVLTYPPGFSATKKYPLVLLIHGGPTAASTVRFDSLAAVLAARGWLVLEPNYRGSNNAGLAFQKAVFEDAEAGPGRDVMAALAAVEARGIVDTTKLGVSGWSYGGIMTSWLVVSQHVWKAALSGAAVNDWVADYATADDATADREIFKGSPFVGDNRADYLRQSAVAYAKDVTTPLLIVHDVGDARDPIVNSYLFYKALRDNGKPVTFVAYPIAGHFPGDPVRTADLYQRWIDWFDGHFK